ncbi:MAG: ROK family protein [Clostridiales bacterium]|nr:ROK family protein [Clostridiales bacterium]
MKFLPVFDGHFQPIYRVYQEYCKKVAQSGMANAVAFCVERNDGYNYIFEFDAYKDGINDSQNIAIADRIVKTILWLVGGYKIYVAGSKVIFDHLKKAYSKDGARYFDADFMSNIYEKEFEVVYCGYDEIPPRKDCFMAIGGHLDGCRIGFDAGGSDRKVSAVVDGKAIYSEEVVWYPKLNTDPAYHYDEIKKAFQTAAQKMPKVDAIGVSSAGIYINNRIMAASLFLKVNKKDFREKVKTMYIDIAKEFGAPLVVANDGDVTALAGSMGLKDNKVLGIAMGTSQAVGYINSSGGLNGWLSELAFVPVDFNKNAMIDEWSGDYGCGVKYFSQDGVIKLANAANIEFDENLSPAQKLLIVQERLEKGCQKARQIFADIGIYLGHTLPYYAMFYDIKHVMILGRVTSGKGGELILQNAKQVLQSQYKHLSNINLFLPDEKLKRVGQSIAAASLVNIGE